MNPFIQSAGNIAPASPRNVESARWTLAELSGRLIEMHYRENSACLSFAAGLLLQAQLSGEPVAWISSRNSNFFPPDLAAAGIDLKALPLIRTPSAKAALRASDKLLRSGAFGLLFVDIGVEQSAARNARPGTGLDAYKAAGRGAYRAGNAGLPLPLQSRILGLAQKHHSAVVFITEKPCEAPSLSSLVSLRIDTQRGPNVSGLFDCTLSAVKDKRRGPGWIHKERFHGPPGLR